MSTLAVTLDKKATPSRFNQRIIDFVNQVEYRPVETDEQMEEVFKLRYEAYRREDFIDKNENKTCTDPLDSTPNCKIFGLYLEGKLISSIRIHLLTKHYRESPSNLVFGDLIDPFLDQGEIMIDPTRFVADYNISQKYKAIHYATLRVAVMASLFYDAQKCLSLVREEHAAFYKKVYHSTRIGDVRHFPSIKFPVVLYSAAVQDIRNNVLQRYPFFKSPENEKATLFANLQPL